MGGPSNAGTETWVTPQAAGSERGAGGTPGAGGRGRGKPDAARARWVTRRAGRGHGDGAETVLRLVRLEVISDIAQKLAGCGTSPASVPGSEATPTRQASRRRRQRTSKAVKGKRGRGKRARQAGRSIEQRGAGGSQDPGTPPRATATSGFPGSPSTPWSCFWFQLSHIWCSFSWPSTSFWSTPCLTASIWSARERGRLGAGPAEPLPTLKHPGERAPPSIPGSGLQGPGSPPFIRDKGREGEGGAVFKHHFVGVSAAPYKLGLATCLAAASEQKHTEQQQRLRERTLFSLEKEGHSGTCYNVDES